MVLVFRSDVAIVEVHALPIILFQVAEPRSIASVGPAELLAVGFQLPVVVKTELVCKSIEQGHTPFVRDVDDVAVDDV